MPTPLAAASPTGIQASLKAELQQMNSDSRQSLRLRHFRRLRLKLRRRYGRYRPYGVRYSCRAGLRPLRADSYPGKGKRKRIPALCLAVLLGGATAILEAAPHALYPIHTNNPKYRTPFNFDASEIQLLGAREIQL